MRTKVGKIDLRKEMKESEEKARNKSFLVKKKCLNMINVFFLSVLAEY